MKSDTAFGLIVRTKRTQLGLTQRALGTKINVAGSYVALLEKGQRRPSFKVITRLAEALSVDRRKLLVLARPEARWIVNRQKSAMREREKVACLSASAMRSVLAGSRVTADEIDILQKLNMLGRAFSAKQLLQLVKLIRAMRRAALT
jgi:transcriptional regulator with XRE-family HTH domain